MWIPTSNFPLPKSLKDKASSKSFALFGSIVNVSVSLKSFLFLNSSSLVRVGMFDAYSKTFEGKS